MDINVELLDQVKDAIRQNPENTDMDRFVGYSHRCGTTYCIAGWVVALGNPGYLSRSAFVKNTEGEALRLLNTSHNGLFFSDCWPFDLRVALDCAYRIHGDAVEYAEVCVRAIDHFVSNPSRFRIRDRGYVVEQN